MVVWPPSDAVSVLFPVIQLSRFMGLAPYTSGSNPKFSSAAMAVSVFVVFSFTIGRIYWSSAYIPGSYGFIDSVGAVVQTYLVTTGNLIAHIITWYYAPQMIRFLEDIQTVDKFLHLTPTQYKRLFVFNVAHVLFVLAILLIDIYVEFSRSDINVSTTFVLLLISELILWYDEVHLVGILILLTNYFKVLNFKIASTRKVYETRIVNNAGTMLYDFAVLFEKLHSICKSVNEMYSVKIVICTLISVLSITDNIFHEFLEFFYTCKTRDHMITLASIIWLLCCVLPIFGYTIGCSLVNEEITQLFKLNSQSELFERSITAAYIIWFYSLGKRSLGPLKADHTALLNQSLNKCIPSKFKNEVKMFSIQLLHQRIQFNACGLFAVDMSLLKKIVGSVTTYVFILIQFIKPEEFRNLETCT